MDTCKTEGVDNSWSAFAWLLSGTLGLLLTGCQSVGLDEFGEPGAGMLQVIPAGELEFGDARVGGEVERTVAVISAGEDAVLIEDIYIEGDPEHFVARDLATPRVIQPGDEMPLSVFFRPDTVGGFNAILVMETPTLDELAISKRLVGDGI